MTSLNVLPGKRSDGKQIGEGVSSQGVERASNKCNQCSMQTHLRTFRVPWLTSGESQRNRDDGRVFSILSQEEQLYLCSAEPYVLRNGNIGETGKDIFPALHATA